MDQDKIRLLEKRIEELIKENNYLKSLLKDKKITIEKSKTSIIQQRIDLYQSYFRGRDDVYAQRWFKNSAKQYSPVVQKKYCSYDPITKKRIISAPPGVSVYEKLTDNVIYNHLSKDNNLAIGLYVIVNNDECYLAAIDFDGSNWQKETILVATTIEYYNLPYILERSQSGNGAHIWFFFDKPIKAKKARQFCSSFITLAMKKSTLIKMHSYDRIFPTQDTIPKKGFGNLIALPLEGCSRQNNNSVFVDKEFEVYENQWEVLKSTEKINEKEVDSFFEKIGDDFDTGILGSDYKKEIEKQSLLTEKEITIVLENGLKFSINDLEPSLINNLKRLASFKNPEFYKAERMNLNTWGKPRIICAAELEEDNTMVIPRGYLNEVLSYFNESFYACHLLDKRLNVENNKLKFLGTLYKEQKEALNNLLQHQIGLLVAPPGFGKTIVSAALIAKRKVTTLVIVHTGALLYQWQKRLKEYLNTEEVGLLGGGKENLNGILDVAIINSLATEKFLHIAQNYSMVIVDEAHHGASFTYIQVLKRVKAKYVYGLTATPIRYDGKHNLVFMQCGPIIHNVALTIEKIYGTIIPVFSLFRCDYHNLEIYQIYEKLTLNEERNRQIANEVLKQIKEKRSIIVLSNRLKQLEILKKFLEEKDVRPFLITGSQSAKVKAKVEEYLQQHEDSLSLPLILSTGKYIGEGFDFPRLDTLILASPIAWKGNVIQYVGRLIRSFENKKEIRVIDFVDLKIPLLMRMFSKRIATYKKFGFEILQNQAKPTEKVFFNPDEFWHYFKKDAINAKRELIVCSNYYVNKTLNILKTTKDIIKKVLITKTIPQYDKTDIVFIKGEKQYPFIATIDKRILWYGQFNAKSSNEKISFIKIEESTYVDDFLAFLKEEFNIA